MSRKSCYAASLHIVENWKFHLTREKSLLSSINQKLEECGRDSRKFSDDRELSTQQKSCKLIKSREALFRENIKDKIIEFHIENQHEVQLKFSVVHLKKCEQSCKLR